MTKKRKNSFQYFHRTNSSIWHFGVRNTRRNNTQGIPDASLWTQHRNICVSASEAFLLMFDICRIDDMETKKQQQEDEGEEKGERKDTALRERSSDHDINSNGSSISDSNNTNKNHSTSRLEQVLPKQLDEADAYKYQRLTKRAISSATPVAVVTAKERL